MYRAEVEWQESSDFGGGWLRTSRANLAEQALEEAGATTYIISPKHDKVKGWEHTIWGQEFPVDVGIDQVNASDYDALLLPGGSDESR